MHHLTYRLLLLVFVATLAGCAAPPQAPEKEKASSDPAARQYAEDFVDDFTRTKISKNGPSLFCDQQGYLQCYRISQQQCLAELSKVTEGCFNATEKKFPSKLKTEGDIDQFAKYYAVCMSIRHATMHSAKDTKQLGTCLKGVKWDKAQRDRSLLK